MRLLILGGTRFVGHAVAIAALREGWEVTTFNRGLSGADVAGVRVIQGDRTLPGDLARLAAAGHGMRSLTPRVTSPARSWGL